MGPKMWLIPSFEAASGIPAFLLMCIKKNDFIQQGLEGGEVHLVVVNFNSGYYLLNWSIMGV